MLCCFPPSERGDEQRVPTAVTLCFSGVRTPGRQGSPSAKRRSHRGLRRSQPHMVPWGTQPGTPSPATAGPCVTTGQLGGRRTALQRGECFHRVINAEELIEETTRAWQGFPRDSYGGLAPDSVALLVCGSLRLLCLFGPSGLRGRRCTPCLFSPRVMGPSFRLGFPRHYGNINVN